MNKFRIPWRNSVYMRMLLLFIAILTPVYVIGLLIYNWGIQAVKEQVYQSMDSQTAYYLNELETKVEQMKILLLDSLNDDNLNNLATISPIMKISERRSAITRLQQRLFAIKSSSELIEDVAAYIPGTDTLVSGVYGYDNIGQEGLKLLGRTGQRFTTAPKLDGDTLKLRAPFPNSRNRKPLFLVEVTLSLEQLDKSLSYLIQPGQDEDAALIRASSGERVAGARTGTIGFAMSTREPPFPPAADGKTFADVEGRSVFAVYHYSKKLDMTLVKTVEIDSVTGPAQTYRKWLWFFLATGLLIVLFFSVSLYRSIHKPLVTVIRAFGKLQAGDLKVRIHRRNKDDFNYLYAHFNRTVEQLNSSIDQAYRQTILAQRAELKQLQAQINPHFLYNSFFMLHRMVKMEDNSKAVVFSKKLGEFFQFVTRNSEDEILLTKEAEHARIYSDIQAMRFVSRLQIDIEPLPAWIQHCYVPRMILQPLIENAIEHGMRNKEKDGRIRISYGRDGERFVVAIEDNGTGMDEETRGRLERSLDEQSLGQETEITALINIHRRLRIKFGPDSGLGFETTPGGGLTVRATIDFGGEKHVSDIAGGR
ncbi:sensor histidine kinase [Cohnella phaseoli]|uniref:Two-component system sensor histidine kinase YesM n=1 Tax=Cohnella phaseoli TaxID=456490 RepID=A0A3D9IJV1_9BACL|nr:histidine kinase [Cohnella phaseoli]RED61927.1 two-component system sensor histidine kinase YesM [Cohnella phaseoli]